MLRGDLVGRTREFGGCEIGVGRLRWQGEVEERFEGDVGGLKKV
jgi:hypothetical protein